MKNNSASTSRVYIPAVDSLRTIFMLVILFHHMDIYPHGCGIAVSFFFILSGFSLTLGYHDRIDNSNFSFRQFITKSLTKFFPIHWLILIVSVACGGVSVMSSENFGSRFLTNFFLVQSFIPDKTYYFSFNSPSWYLCDALFCCFSPLHI